MSPHASLLTFDTLTLLINQLSPTSLISQSLSQYASRLILSKFELGYLSLANVTHSFAFNLTVLACVLLINVQLNLGLTVPRVIKQFSFCTFHIYHVAFVGLFGYRLLRIHL
jgi:hypothetical protein